MQQAKPIHQFQIMRDSLAKAEPRINGNFVARNTRIDRRHDTAFQKFIYFNRCKPVMWIILHRFRRALHMHDDDRHPAIGCRRQRAIAAQSTYIIDNSGTCFGCPRHNIGMACIDRNQCTGLGKTGDRRQDTSQFLIAGNRFRTRAR